MLLSVLAVLVLKVSFLVKSGNRVVVWTGYLSNIVHILSKFVNFWVAKCMKIMVLSMEIQKYRNSSLEVLS